MRKLIVKNFSVIKEAELEFGKITVLIGPQSSGKSLLCKLAYFLSRELIESAVKCVMEENTLVEFKSLVRGTFQRRFPDYGWLNESFNAEFVADRYKVKIVGKQPPAAEPVIWDYPRCSFDFSAEFEHLYEYYVRRRPERDLALASRLDLQDVIWTSFNFLLSGPDICEALYIPAGRAFFTDASKGFSALQNTDLDPLTRQFASEISWNTRWRIGLVTAGDDVVSEIRKTMFNIAKGEVVVTLNEPAFRTDEDKSLPLNLLSSGTQELLPLFNVLDRLASLQEHREVSRNATRIPPYDKPPVGTKKLIYLEEPEANIFPETQYELVRLFAWLSHEPNLDFSWVITTHSPYILSAFNNLIEAGQAARNNPTLHGEVAKIIPEQYWIKEGDFKAYAIEDGILKSIVAKDTGLVSANYLDQVSETIGMEFDELLRLGYVES